MSAEGGRSALRDAAAWAILAAGVLVVAWPLGLTNRILAGIDAFTYFTPYWSYRMAAFRGGAVPLWNPYLFSGSPFLANIQAAVLYPLHWPLSWLRPEQALIWSAILHAWLAAGFTYLLARSSLRAGRPAALFAGFVFGLGGFTLARMENINQLNALAWLPALLWLYDKNLAVERNSGKDAVPFCKRLLPFIGLSVVISLQLLAGHTQTTFINMVGLGLWGLFSLGRPPRFARLLPLLAVVPALVLSAAQLLPTLELNTLGLRTGGLGYLEAVSFSLRPQLLLQSLLPPFAGGLGEAFGSEGYAEFVGYTGISSVLLAALGAVHAWRNWRAGAAQSGRNLRPVVLVVAGMLLALGAYNPLYFVLWRLVPGFDLFRAPARWLELFVLGIALLAALGLDALPTSIPRLRLPAKPTGRALILAAAIIAVALLALQSWPSWVTVLGWLLVAGVAWMLAAWRRNDVAPRVLLLLLLFLELLLASRSLPYTLATAPMATSLRNAPAVLLAATAGQSPAGRDRFLSMSNIRYDPGDLAELRALQADRLPDGAVDRLVRAAKQVEVLAPNLSLFYQLPAVDGYDGGLLPLQRYVKLQELFLSPEGMTPDGRLREQLTQIPPAVLLDLTRVRFVVTDKQRDLWADDVYYDLEQSATLQAGETLSLDLAGYVAFSADALGIMAHGERTEISVVLPDQEPLFVASTLQSEPSEPPRPSILSLPQPVTPIQIDVRNTGATPLVVQGISLIDRRTGSHASVTVSPEGDFRRIHSGDVKVYERLEAPGRAWIVHGVRPVSGPDEAQAVIRAGSFDPRSEALVEAAVAAQGPQAGASGERVSTTDYTAEHASFSVELASPGLLVLADAWYPGWEATVDGQPAEILHANLLFRAVALEAGSHEVILTYRPSSWQWGLWISAASLLALLIALTSCGIIHYRKGHTA